MAAFSYQYHPFLVDSSSFLPNINIGPPSHLQQQQHHHQFHLIHRHMENSKFDAMNNQNETIVSCVDQISDNEPSVTKNNNNIISPQSSSMVVDNKPESGEQVTQKAAAAAPSAERKRRISRHVGPSLSSPQSKDAIDERSKKMRKSNNNNKKNNRYNNNGVEEEEKGKGGGKSEEEAQTGYIHVRARRGQATDSHSLAERVRREKISERMKMLQRLVPGCDKVTGKALMLDEIINYVQSLQNQVEFLSMKLASVNPMFYDLATDLDALMVRPEKLNSMTSISLSSSQSPAVSVQHCSNTNNQGTSFGDTTTTMTTTTTTATTTMIPNTSDYLFDGPTSVFLQGQRSNVLNEDNGNDFWGAEDQRQKLLHQYGFMSNNLCSFH